MTQDNQPGSPIEEAGGYGTPRVEQETDAAGVPDGSGTDLPGEKSPRDREGDGDTFDAG